MNKDKERFGFCSVRSKFRNEKDKRSFASDDYTSLFTCRQPGAPWYNMITMNPQLPPNIRQAVEECHGCTEAESDGAQLVVMTKQLYMEMLGIGSEAELKASAEEIERRIASAKTGPTRPFRDVLKGLQDNKLPY